MSYFLTVSEAESLRSTNQQGSFLLRPLSLVIDGHLLPGLPVHIRVLICFFFSFIVSIYVFYLFIFN